MAKEISKYKTINTIRYMGNKEKLLDYIIPEIEEVVDSKDVVCDIMAGTNAVGYALLEKCHIISNDVQYYSYVIGMSLLKSNSFDLKTAIRDLDANIKKNLKDKVSCYLTKNYADTYFSKKQCLEIDSIRYAIEQAGQDNKNYYNYLTVLMNAMCKAQSTTGHFAQFLNKEHYRVQSLRCMSIVDLFYSQCEEMKNKTIPRYKNHVYNYTYEKLFEKLKNRKIKCFYLDPPYTHDQYSRFYHLLETVCRNDSPSYEYKAKYRKDRFMSKFCYVKTVLEEFENIISYVYNKKSNLIISYSNKGVADLDELLKLCKKYYKNTKIKKIEFKHSSQGKGTIRISEVILILKYKEEV